MKIDIAQIQINIKNDRYFSDLALAIDDPKAMKLIKKARKELGIKRLFSLKKYKDYARSKVEHKHPEPEVYAEKIRKELMLPIVFTKAIEKAVLCGRVDDGDYAPAYLDVKEGFFDKEKLIPDDTYSIVLSPRVKDEDVLSVLHDYESQLGNNAGVETYRYIQELRKVEESKSALRNHRCWYWLHNKNKWNPNKIFEECIENCPVHIKHPEASMPKLRKQLDPSKCLCDLGLTTVRDGIKNYTTLLKRI